MIAIRTTGRELCRDLAGITEADWVAAVERARRLTVFRLAVVGARGSSVAEGVDDE